MNRDEAKYILRAYHLGGQDADDPQFQEALGMVKSDPVLAKWFAHEQALDIRLSEKIRAFPVPPDLRTQLLAARKVIPLHVWWRPPAWIAVAAACAALMAAFTVFLLRPSGNRQFAEFRSYVADTTAKLDHLDLMSNDVDEVRRWLRDRSAPDDFVTPASLNGRPRIGCRVFEWKGQHVSLVCFRIEGGREAHLFVVDRATLRGAPNGTMPEFAMMDGIATASWSKDRRTYVLATDAGEEELKRLL
ncbi:MAG TPA: hypothetical protein VN887_08860 [Candidatus Angelobacter sp.]|nr:hypothetical protein [Candidatus Angelobacter sp.]